MDPHHGHNIFRVDVKNNFTCLHLKSFHLGWIIFLRGMFAYAQLKRYVYARTRLARQNTVLVE